MDVETPLIEKPAGEIRSLKSLQDFINTLKQHGVDSLHTSTEVSIDDYHLSLSLCKAQVDARYNRTVGLGRDRKYLAWHYYTDLERVALKKKLCGAYQAWQRFRNCWPLDIIMTRLINNKKQAARAVVSKAKVQREQEKAEREERRRDARIVSTHQKDTRATKEASEELFIQREQPLALLASSQSKF
jgi:hypothetical protein